LAVIPRRRRRSNPTGTMTLMQHLDELRTRLIISVLAVAGGTIVAWPLYRFVIQFLTNPYCDYVTKHPGLAVNPNDPCALTVFSVVEPFTIKLKVVTFMGLLIALPVVLYEFWRFVTPGLLQKERRYALPFVFVSILLFALGAWFAILTLPKALDFLIGFAGTFRLQTVLSFSKYLGFVTLLILAFGASFEFPLVLISLTLVGVLSSRKLRKARRYALLGVAVFAALITPSQDWFTMTAMMLPLILFYELSILVARLLKR
jgi:sec-independent protein translocase protein TatC